MTMEELLQIQSDLEAHEKDLESQILDLSKSLVDAILKIDK
jgi:hypothetical protein